MKQHTPTLPELLDLIERFFDCSLSDTEELQLRHAIAKTSFSSPAIDEARAVMGLRIPARRRQRQHRNLRPAMGIAAAVAVLLTIGVYHLFVSPATVDFGESKCIAYANCRCFTDEEDVINLLREDLREFDNALEASDRSFEDELCDIASIIQTYESPM